MLDLQFILQDNRCYCISTSLWCESFLEQRRESDQSIFNFKGNHFFDPGKEKNEEEEEVIFCGIVLLMNTAAVVNNEL